MWKTEKRYRYNRDQRCYPCDLTDEEWGVVEHLIPPAKRGGVLVAKQPRRWTSRQVFSKAEVLYAA